MSFFMRCFPSYRFIILPPPQTRSLSTTFRLASTAKEALHNISSTTILSGRSAYLCDTTPCVTVNTLEQGQNLNSPRTFKEKCRLAPVALQDVECALFNVPSL
eukprot:TRINITY_DN4647_c0_g1::TRINITY_DN4647_c0_g1_i1::g.19622::m.19622 TRINITY_DN4647_c0_g1::TRINITY_DN4647_c0_g1_i1::g.19622  ORF type:complete len:103 (-),score=-1.01,DUF448/PF04296.8/0.015 TRINITY_DN4647_c0_g1_i1:354-662(-)